MHFSWNELWRVAIEGPDKTYREAWDELLEEKGIGGWDYENDRLQIPYDDTKPEERSRMKMVLNFEPRMLGTEFNPLQKTVSIYPENQYDARRWADDLFMDKVRDYLTCEEYQKITEEIKAQLPDFEVSLKAGPNISRKRNADPPSFGTCRQQRTGSFEQEDATGQETGDV